MTAGDTISSLQSFASGLNNHSAPDTGKLAPSSASTRWRPAASSKLGVTTSFSGNALLHDRRLRLPALTASRRAQPTVCIYSPHSTGTPRPSIPKRVGPGCFPFASRPTVLPRGQVARHRAYDWRSLGLHRKVILLRALGDAGLECTLNRISHQVVSTRPPTRFQQCLCFVEPCFRQQLKIGAIHAWMARAYPALCYGG